MAAVLMQPLHRIWCWSFAGLPLALGVGYLLVTILPLPPCSMRRVFGIDCAMCGGTRATLAWHHGQLAEAWTLNPLVTIGLFGVWGLGLAGVLGLLFPRMRVQVGRLGAWIGAHPYPVTALIFSAVGIQWGWAIWRNTGS